MRDGCVYNLGLYHKEFLGKKSAGRCRYIARTGTRSLSILQIFHVCHCIPPTSPVIQPLKVSPFSFLDFNNTRESLTCRHCDDQIVQSKWHLSPTDAIRQLKKFTPRAHAHPCLFSSSHVKVHLEPTITRPKNYLLLVHTRE